MKKDKYNLTKEQLRRYNRRKAQRQAYMLVAAAAVVVLLLLGGLGFGIYKLVHKNPAPVSEPEPEVVEVPEVVVEEEPEIVEEEPEVVEEPEETVSEDSVADENPGRLTDEQMQAVLDDTVNSYIANMTLEEKVAGLFMVTPTQLTNQSNMTEAGSRLNEALIDYPVGGILLDGSNIESLDQVKDMTFNIRSFSSKNIFVAVQDYGGSDSVFAKNEIMEGEISGPNEIGETKENSNAYTAGIAIGSLLERCGFDTVLGPVADITYSAGAYTANHSFGSDPEEVRGMVRNMIHGEVDQQLNVCVQYFPSYGDITTNPASARPVSSRTAEDIKNNEYQIYKDAINGGVKMIMVSQVAYKPITVDVPACLSSKVVTDMLRTDLKYDGVIATDYMSTRSLIDHYKHADMAVMAIEAGCDLIVSPGNFQKAYNGIIDAVNSGKISEERIDESLRRIYRVKYANLVDYAGVNKR